jgi:hypothetical protein
MVSCTGSRRIQFAGTVETSDSGAYHYVLERRPRRPLAMVRRRAAWAVRLRLRCCARWPTPDWPFRRARIERLPQACSPDCARAPPADGGDWAQPPAKHRCPVKHAQVRFGDGRSPMGRSKVRTPKVSLTTSELTEVSDPTFNVNGARNQSLP